jgi:hypothetical protein
MPPPIAVVPDTISVREQMGPLSPRKSRQQQRPRRVGVQKEGKDGRSHLFLLPTEGEYMTT